MHQRRGPGVKSDTDYGRSPAWAAFLFCGYVLFFYLQGGYRIPALGAIRAELILGSVLGAVALTVLLQRRQQPALASTSIPKWIFGLLVIAVLMTVMSEAPNISVPVLTDRVLKFVLMAVFITAFVDSPSRLRWFLFAYLLSFFKMMQEGILGLFTGSLVWENQGTPRLHGATPNYEHPNSFSGTQLGTLPILLNLLPVVSKWWKVIVAAQALGAIAIVVTTGSRTGYVALLLWAGMAIWKSKSRVRAIFLALLAVTAALPLIPQDYYERFETIFTQQDAEGQSINMRKEILSDAWKIFSASPLGVGVGAFIDVRTRTFGRTQPTHNLYLEVACDMGVQGLILFLGFLICMLFHARRIANELDKQISQLPGPSHPLNLTAARRTAMDSHLSDLTLMRAAARGVYGFLIIRMGLGLFGHDFYEIYWWFAAGLLMALSNMLPVASRRTAEYAELSPVESQPATVSRVRTFTPASAQ